MIDRETLEAALREHAQTEAPLPDPAFVDALERRLQTLDSGAKVVPFARRARRISAATVVISLAVAGVAAAAAGIVVTHPFDDAEPVPTSPITDASVPSTEPVATVPISEVTTTSTGPDPSTPTTAPVVVPTSAAPATTASPTTEVHVPATISLTCTTTGTSVMCTWSAAPPGTVRFGVLRGQPGGGPGRVFFVDVGTTTWTDPMPSPGTQFSYVVHAFGPGDVSLAHSNLVLLSCC